MIVIIGMGALGSHALLALRDVGSHNQIRVGDFDFIEMKNCASQFHTKLGLRKNKALAIRDALNGLFGVKVEANTNRVTPDNAETILKGADLVIDCTDNGTARRTIAAASKRLGIPLLHGAMNLEGDFARIIWDELFVVDDETPGQATCEDGAHLPFHMLAGSWIAVVAQTFLQTGKRMSIQITPSSFVRLS